MASRAMLPQMLVLPIALTLMISHVMGDSTQEKQKCVEQMTGITTCLPYVGGNAKAPTPDCCSGLIQAIKNTKKCLCIILKDRNNPDLGLKINITIALGLPSLCKAPDNVSQCPVLHLDPKSPEAQAFNQMGQNTNSGSTSPHIPSAEGSFMNGKNQGTDVTITRKNGASRKGKRLLECSFALTGLLIWFFLS